MISLITMVEAEVVGGRQGAVLAGPGGPLITKDGRLVGQDSAHDGAHVGAEGLHILADEDSVLLGLIPEGLETSGKVKHRALQDMGRTGRIVLRGRMWWRGMGRGLWRWGMGGGLSSAFLGVYQETKPGLILSKLILIRGFIARVINRLSSWYTGLVTLDHDWLNHVYPSLVIL